MDLTAELKAEIDSMSYEDMLRKWRFSPAGTPLFCGESGPYFAKVMAAKKAQDPDGAVQASKRLGWG